jgi:hypothetical protein
MTGQYSQNCKPIAGVASVGFVLATFCKLGGAAAQGCNILSSTAWAALEVFRSLIVLADWQAVSAYLFQNSGPLQHLLHIIASICPLLCFMASWTK